ncbi:MAG: LytR C-terminal domain-containing protein [Ignavibacteria bacterium]
MSETKNHKTTREYLLNVTIIILLGLCGYLIISLILSAYSEKKPGQREAIDTIIHPTKQPNFSIQIRIENGTGENRIGATFREYLKKKGYDVVELDNYKSTEVEKTLIIDRIGDLKKAIRIAEALGVSQRNIVQMIDPTKFVDATVIIGKDYKELKPFLEKTK